MKEKIPSHCGSGEYDPGDEKDDDATMFATAILFDAYG